MTDIPEIPNIKTPSTPGVPDISEATIITEEMDNIDETDSSPETDVKKEASALREEKDITKEAVGRITAERKTDGLQLAEETISPIGYEKEVLNAGKELGVLPDDSYKGIQEKIIAATENYLEDVDNIQNYTDKEIDIQEEANWLGFTRDKNFSPETKALLENLGLNDLLKDYTPEEQKVLEGMRHKIFDTLPPEEKNRLLEEKNIINSILKQEAEKDSAEEFRKLMIRLAVKVSVKVAVAILKNIQKSSESKAAKVTCGTLADLLEAGGKEFDKAYTGQVNPDDLTIALKNHFFGEA